MEITGGILLLAGSVFFLVSSLGLIRMPDIYNRIQAGTKATTLGTILVIAGILFLNPLAWPKLLTILLFILLTNPISSHVVARASHYSNEDKASVTIVDDLEKSYKKDA